MPFLHLSQESQKILYGAIEALIFALNQHDPFSYGHGERVATYASILCKELQLPHREQKLIHLTALLHDIGKIGIPDFVLQSPENPNDAEWRLIQGHPQIGALMIKPIEPLREITNGILQHHEWINGQGYPMGLKGNDIVLSAKIVSICNAYDAMTSECPYRNVLSPSTAIKRLLKASGTQFDPDLVNAFVKIFNDGKLHKHKQYAEDDGSIVMY